MEEELCLHVEIKGEGGGKVTEERRGIPRETRKERWVGGCCYTEELAVESGLIQSQRSYF